MSTALSTSKPTRTRPGAFGTGVKADLRLPTVYRAIRMPDGSVRVPGVPIFGENRRSTYTGDLSYTKEWLTGALRADQALRADGYRVPLHYGHHEPGIVREAAGSVEFDAVALRVYSGEPTWVLFGTLVFKTEAKFAKAKADFPYRSVEISHEKPSEINSLALLDSDAPYFRFPNLSFRALPENGRSYLWRMQFSMADPIVPAEKDPKDEKLVKAESDTDTGSDPMAAFAARLDKLEAVMMKLAGSEEGEGQRDGKPAGDATATQTHVPVVSASAIAELEGKFASQKAHLDRLTAEIAEKESFATLSTSLKPYGIPNLDKELKARIKDGTAQAWAAGVTSNPVARRSAEQPVEQTDPPEVAAYATHGPDALAKARALARTYQAAPKKSFVRNHPLAAFLASNVPVEE